MNIRLSHGGFLLLKCVRAVGRVVLGEVEIQARGALDSCVFPLSLHPKYLAIDIIPSLRSLYIYTQLSAFHPSLFPFPPLACKTHAILLRTNITNPYIRCIKQVRAYHSEPLHPLASMQDTRCSEGTFPQPNLIESLRIPTEQTPATHAVSVEKVRPCREQSSAIASRRQDRAARITPWRQCSCRQGLRQSSIDDPVSCTLDLLR